jgi:hypothetical protein
MNTTLTNKYISALSKRYEAQIAEAEANLTLYLSGQNLAAIGEHSDLMEEQDRWITKLAEAKDKLETLKSVDLQDSNVYKSINS